MEDLKSGKLIKVLSRDGIPKHNHVWMQDITYYNFMIQAGYTAILFYDNGNRYIKTTCVLDVQEDENNLAIQTENSVYHIKKY